MFNYTFEIKQFLLFSYQVFSDLKFKLNFSLRQIIKGEDFWTAPNKLNLPTPKKNNFYPKKKNQSTYQKTRSISDLRVKKRSFNLNFELFLKLGKDRFFGENIAICD